MVSIEWNDELCVGVKEVDDQHKKLIHIANELIEAVRQEHCERPLENIFRELREYTMFHFQKEEALMEKVAYPKREEHAAEHTRLKTNVMDHHKLVYEREGCAPDAMLAFMKDWLLGHILTYDRELAAFIHKQQAIPEVQWSDKLSLGVPQIDDQHKELIRIANGLIKAVHRGKDKIALDRILKKLREYTVFHFSSEEKLMEDIRYPGRGDQAREHARLKKEVKSYQRMAYQKEDLTPDTILEFMTGWLLRHILDYDRELAKFIHEKEAENTLVEDDK